MMEQPDKPQIRGVGPAVRDPRIVTQPDNWSCYACVAAMATGKRLQAANAGDMDPKRLYCWDTVGVLK